MGHVIVHSASSFFGLWLNMRQSATKLIHPKGGLSATVCCHLVVSTFKHELGLPELKLRIPLLGMSVTVWISNGMNIRNGRSNYKGSPWHRSSSLTPRTITLYNSDPGSALKARKKWFTLLPEMQKSPLLDWVLKPPGLHLSQQFQLQSAVTPTFKHANKCPSVFFPFTI